MILFTGGTIAGVGNSTSYTSGVLEPELILKDLGEQKEQWSIEAVPFCNLNSDDIGEEHWIRMAGFINEQAAREDLDGFVILHGTDTMEETAYFLQLTLKTEKPVILTGAMKPATELSADGPMNLCQALCTASSDFAAGMGVLIVFDGMIYDATTVGKVSTCRSGAFSAGDLGAIGRVQGQEVVFLRKTLRKHTLQTEFVLQGVESLPKVNVLFFAADASPELVRMAAEISDGLVIAGAGSGQFSLAFEQALDALSIPVVVSTRVQGGILRSGQIMGKNTIPADIHGPAKAAVLLRLALLLTKDPKELERCFKEY